VLEFRILGALDVREDGRRIEFREGNDAALLTLLLLHAGRPLAVDRIVDELWPDDPPASARKIVQNSVSRLRRALGEERLETRGHAYLLHAEPEEIDAAQFERLVGEGHGADALHLWRGPPTLDGDRFEELYLTALEQRLAADVAAGRTGTVAELETLVRRHPYRERLRALQMRALYTAGRQADALDAYRAAARTLREELGLEPGAELRELEQAILRQEVAEPQGPPPDRRRTRRRLWPVAAIVVVAAAAVAAVLLSYGTGDARNAAVVPNSLAVIDPASDRIVGDVRVGSHPRGIAVGADAVWVANTSDATVMRIDPQKLALLKTYGVGGAAIDIAIEGDTVWVSTDGDDTLVRIDARTQALETFPLPPGSGAEAVAVAPGVVWAAGLTVYRVDPVSGAVVQKPPAPNCCVPSDVIATPHSIWTNRYQRAVRLDPHTLREQTVVELDSNDLHLAYGEGAVWVSGWRYTDTNGHISHVWKLDDVSGTTEAETGVGDAVEAIAVGAGAVWTANQDAGTVSKLDPKTGELVDTIHVGGHPDGVAVGDGRVWVAVSSD
jgi:DNA-binding SARP family transcriptional activator/streptogramin lyase